MHDTKRELLEKEREDLVFELKMIKEQRDYYYMRIQQLGNMAEQMEKKIINLGIDD